MESVSIPNDIARFHEIGILDALLKDRTTGNNIIWGTASYEQFDKLSEITPEEVTGEYAGCIRRRAQKDKDEKTALTRVHAEVFTPAWIVKFMVDAADEAWREGRRKKSLSDGWQSYVSSNRLEITCGEAPYLVNRYDAADGSVTPIAERAGILSCKLAFVNENAKTRATWVKWAKTALKSIYGYEYQGDNLLIARINVLCTMEDYLKEAGFEGFTVEEYEELADIISWNLWQMDGLTKCVPFGKSIKDAPAPSLFDAFDEPKEEVYSDCLIYDWEKGESITFSSIRRDSDMKFDYIIGNPPYQEESRGANESDTPLYHYFYDGCVAMSDYVELITPARFLFNAGGTPKAWNEQMLSSNHFKVLEFFPVSKDVFPATDIKGGVAISCVDQKRSFTPIEIFTPFEELNSILNKVTVFSERSLSEVITNRGVYRYSERAYEEEPDELKKTADARIAPSSFERMPKIFTEDKPDNTHEYIQMIGNIGGNRVYRWIRRDFVKEVDNLNKFKVVIPKANGSGALGEVLSTPLIGAPLIGFTETFIAINPTDDEKQAEACLKYVKGKFARVMLGILKVTQNNAKPTWKYVPLQDFSSSSDIDWSQSVAEIDEQLYRKYGLSPEEIEFIETHVKAMD